MKKIVPVIFASLLVSSIGFAQKPCKQVIGYWAGWKDNASVNYSQYTIMNMSFANPQADGSINASEYASKIPGMVSKAHAAGSKAMLSIGGWTWSSNFSTIAASQAARQKFASQCASLIQQYGLDGVDIDWEYPNADNGGRPQDTTNFPIFMQAIRSAIGSKLLTACFSPAQHKMDFIKWSVVAQTLDYINMMTYDMTGSWDNMAYHNSPLRKADGGDPTLNIDAVVAHLINEHNVPRSKIVIGAPFYGQGMVGVDKLFGPMGGGDGTPSYTEILQKKSQYTEYWDDKAVVPYLLNTSTKKYISYDNPRSIEAKGQFVVDNQLAGVIVWEVSQDGGVLAAALAKGLCNLPSSVGQELASKPLIYPNPVHDLLNIIVKDGGAVNQVSVINTMGQVVYSGRFNQKVFEINMEGFDNGLYFVSITNEYGVNTEKILIQK